MLKENSKWKTGDVFMIKLSSGDSLIFLLVGELDDENGLYFTGKFGHDVRSLRKSLYSYRTITL